SDWMPRNLDRRVEVLAPIEDPEIKRRLKNDYLDAYLKDNQKARRLLTDGSYERIRDDGEPFSVQLSFQERSNVVEFGNRRD
ncbi:MAG: RNA degradosome polyphosphate kinase, partial [Pyrinomonadaceae bacterium]